METIIVCSLLEGYEGCLEENINIIYYKELAQVIMGAEQSQALQ